MIAVFRIMVHHDGGSSASLAAFLQVLPAVGYVRVVPVYQGVNWLFQVLEVLQC